MSTAQQFPWLAPKLRELAQMYFDGEEMNTVCGICRPLTDITGGDGDRIPAAYRAINSVMDELNFQSAYFGGLHADREKWEPRAFLCLLLAEYLEGSAE